MWDLQCCQAMDLDGFSLSWPWNLVLTLFWSSTIGWWKGLVFLATALHLTVSRGQLKWQPTSLSKCVILKVCNLLQSFKRAVQFTYFFFFSYWYTFSLNEAVMWYLGTVYERSSRSSDSGAGAGVGAGGALSHGPWAGGVSRVNGELVDSSVMAGLVRDGVWRGRAVHPSVPGDPEDQQHRGLFHPRVPGSAHR